MAKIIRFTLGLLVLSSPLAAQNPFTGIEFGSASGSIPATARDVSNKNDWDETAYEILNPAYTLLNKFKPSKCTLTYYHDRLYAALCKFPRAQFEAIYTNLVAVRQTPNYRELAKAERSATWFGEFKDGRRESVLRMYHLGSDTLVSYSDETQKDFRFTDLFKGMTPWLILTIVGLIGGYMLFGWLMTSKCPKCKQRKLKITGKTFQNPRDYNPDILGNPDIHWDEVYHYKCSNCGFEKDDRYSGFWNWWRNQ